MSAEERNGALTFMFANARGILNPRSVEMERILSIAEIDD
jgi:hypothetical protein